VVEGAGRCRLSHENVIGARVRRDPSVTADGKEVAEGRAAGEQGVEEGVEGPGSAGPGEGRVREGATRGGGEAGAAVGGDDAAEELLAGPGTRGGGGEAGEDGLHGREEARGSEPGDDEVVAAEGVARRSAAARWYDENLLLTMAAFRGKTRVSGQRSDVLLQLYTQAIDSNAVDVQSMLDMLLGRLRPEHKET
jgi:hypothetical protein